MASAKITPVPAQPTVPTGADTFPTLQELDLTLLDFTLLDLALPEIDFTLPEPELDLTLPEIKFGVVRRRSRRKRKAASGDR